MTELKPVKLSDFLDWFRSVEIEAASVRALFEEQLSDDPESLKDQLCRIEPHGSRVGKLLADANSFLDLAERKFLKPKRDLTELDREKSLAAEVAVYRRVRDVLENYDDKIERRINLGQSLLKALQRETSHHAT